MAEDKILLVDDEVEFTNALAERMQTRGLEVDAVDSGMAALEAARGKDFSAIILDLSMPGMDGIETLKRLREENPDLQIIVLTGRATVEKGVEAMKLGALDFLEKPVDIQKIMEKIELAKGKKRLLMTKRFQEQIDNILKKKGW
ncbi:MAG: response regulator [Chitinivibrionia bacterium]|nr:response regulator [Chitinivibrionia bacterium]